jgi:hypothetical protein
MTKETKCPFVRVVDAPEHNRVWDRSIVVATPEKD